MKSGTMRFTPKKQLLPTIEEDAMENVKSH